MQHLLESVDFLVADETRGIYDILALHNGNSTRKAICIRQPHASKKEILFTSLIFAIYFAQKTNREVIFSTDSDTVIRPEALENVVRMMHSDENIGGVSGHMQFFHEKPTYISNLASAYYWNQQDVAKIQGAASGFNECQPGPCAGFRVDALKEILVPWVGQKVFGTKMVCFPLLLTKKIKFLSRLQSTEAPC